jgi:hypothetical protein
LVEGWQTTLAFLVVVAQFPVNTTPASATRYRRYRSRSVDERGHLDKPDTARGVQAGVAADRGPDDVSAVRKIALNIGSCAFSVQTAIVRRQSILLRDDARRVINLGRHARTRARRIDCNPNSPSSRSDRTTAKPAASICLVPNLPTTITPHPQPIRSQVG